MRSIDFVHSHSEYSHSLLFTLLQRACEKKRVDQATPKSIQSLAYLLRNDILDNLDNLRAELQYQLQSSEPTSNDDDDVRQLTTAAYTAMQKYLDIIPPNEYQRALELLQQPPPK